MSINIIACVSLNCGLGNNGELLVKLPNDLRRFKKLTNNNFIVMGRRTYEEIGKPLPDRTNFILSRSGNIDFHPEVFVYDSAESILQEYYDHADTDIELFICGGSKVYSEFFPYVDKVFLTIVYHEFKEVDTVFPIRELDNFKIKSYERHKADDKHPYDYAFVEYKRK